MEHRNTESNERADELARLGSISLDLQAIKSYYDLRRDLYFKHKRTANGRTSIHVERLEVTGQEPSHVPQAYPLHVPQAKAAY